MNWFRKVPPFLAALLICSSGFAAKKEDASKPPAKGEKKQKDKRKKGDGDAKLEKGKSEEAEADAPGRISVPVPPGHDAKGLVIPHRDAEGKLQMRFTMEVGSRIDADHLKMTTLLIETFDADEKPEMTVNLPDSVLDLNTRIVSTENTVLIKRADFELTGQTMEFNTETRAGRLGGKVRMLIYNLDDETNSDPDKKR
jgi:hypothetical protein